MEVEQSQRLNYKQRKYLKKKERKKKAKQKAVTAPVDANIKTEPTADGTTDAVPNGAPTEGELNVEVEYITVNPLDEMSADDPMFAEFSDIISKFNAPASSGEEDGAAAEADGEVKEEGEKQEEAGESEEVGKLKKKLSKRQRRLQRRLNIAVLKQLVKRPDLVEIWDTCAADPFLLCHLKSYRNVVPVPRHWKERRKYLQGKRGIEKKPWELPPFIRETGIAEIRQAILEKEAKQKLKQKQRERLQPKMGKIDIDYQVLHDAFFRRQTKPPLTRVGDLYYEGKEFEVKAKEKIPGQLSEELKKALGMPPGAPPPWIIHMQRFGPPPSYPRLRIPGVNAPIPPTGDWGYHPGGWGRPPVDEHGRPLWGWHEDLPPLPEIAAIDKQALWGVLPPEEEESVSEEEEMAVEGEEGIQESGEEPRALTEEELSRGDSISGLETPSDIQLRKYTQAPETPV